MTRPRIQHAAAPWAIRAAGNVLDLLPYLTEPGDHTPVVSIEDMAARIQRTFPDRQTFNRHVWESQQLEPEEKLWLIVPWDE